MDSPRGDNGSEPLPQCGCEYGVQHNLLISGALLVTEF